MMHKLSLCFQSQQRRAANKLKALRPLPGSTHRGQSFIELALILPILFVILLGLIEVAFFIGRYLDMLDLTREAARFASVRDPFEDTSATRDLDCSTTEKFDFFYDTACLFSPPSNAEICTAACAGSTAAEIRQCQYCNGLNSYFNIDLNVDDVLITVYTVDSSNQISNTHPDAAHGGKVLSDGQTNYWALSNTDSDTANDDMWTKDCNGNVERSLPDFYKAKMQSMIESDAPGRKGFVVVEAFYCYHQVLGVPLISNFIPNPMRIHAYTIMPLPAAQPTAIP